MGDKHDAGCLRRKAEMRFPYLCTCDLSDGEEEGCLMADIERRLIVARALAAEHGAPLGFHDEEDQLDWDRKACAVLSELDALQNARAALSDKRCDDHATRDPSKPCCRAK